MGFLQWFPIGEKELVESTLRDLEAMRVKYLRTGFSWADWEDESRQNPLKMSGKEWYGWLMPQLKKECFDILPNFLYTPFDKARPDKAGMRRTSHPPQNPEDYAKFLSEALEEYRDCFEYVELLNEPHLKQEWNSELDPDYHIYAEMISQGSKVAKQFGKKVVLGGIVVHHLDWLVERAKLGFLENVDVVGIHAFPYFKWGDKHSAKPVSKYAEDFKSALAPFSFKGEIWLTETGFPTKGEERASEEKQAEIFENLMQQKEIERVYWWSLTDLRPETLSYTESQIGFREELFYHFGLKTHDGRPKLLFNKLASGELLI